MKKKLNSLLWVVSGLLIFLGTLELGSWALLSLGLEPESVTPDFEFGTWEKVEKAAQSSGEQKPLAKLLLDFRKRHPEILEDPIVNLRLINEPGRYPPDPVHHNKALYSHDGYNPDVSDTFILRSLKGNEIKYSAHYETDAFGRRKLPVVEKPEFNLIFIGCSFTWGEGLPLEKTFPGFLVKSFPHVQMYNLGRSALGPMTIHSILKDTDLFIKGIDKERPTYILFTFIEDHYRRSIGSSHHLHVTEHAYKNNKYYELESDGTLVYDRTFSETLRGQLLKAFGASHLAKLTGVELPIMTASHYELIAKVLGEIKEIYAKEVNLQKFIVASFPWGDPGFPRLAGHLRNESIMVLDYSGIDSVELFQGHQILPADPHPSELSHELYSLLLSQDLAPLLKKN